MSQATNPQYVYTIQEGKLLRYLVESFNPDTSVFVGYHKGRKVRGSLDCSMFFRTPDEALKEEHDGYKQGVHDAAQEVRDAIAAYLTIKKVATMSFEEFKLALPTLED